MYEEQKSFPPKRFDKVALLDPSPAAIGMLQTSELGSGGGKMLDDETGEGAKAHFSDHLGLWCDFEWAEDRPKV